MREKGLRANAGVTNVKVDKDRCETNVGVNNFLFVKTDTFFKRLRSPDIVALTSLLSHCLNFPEFFSTKLSKMKSFNIFVIYTW